MEISMWRQSASFLGAMLILIAYAGHQMGGMKAAAHGLQHPERGWFRDSRLHRLSSLPTRLRHPRSDVDRDQHLRLAAAAGAIVTTTSLSEFRSDRIAL
jgi:hypothetical protein